MDAKPLGHTCVIGLQWGDEGKGKVVDFLVDQFDVVVRYGGGANAGHTVVVGGDRFALHQLPSGILRPNITNMITCGSVVDPAVLLGEIASLGERGIHVGGNLRISERAHVVMPYHRLEDQRAERVARPGEKLGTTSRGIGPCYGDKVGRRWGLRLCDLLQADRLRERLAAIVAHKNAYFASLYDERVPLDAGALTEECLAFGEQLRPFVGNTTVELHNLMKQGKRVLFEGAQGCMLDIDHGTYPYVTSSSTGVDGVSSGAGVPPAAIGAVLGVVKAYATRVGEGPLPTELTGAVGDRIRDRGREFGTTTGRPRRCGWFDAVAGSYAAMLAGPTHLAIMHLDTLSGIDEIRVCIGYRTEQGALLDFPADTQLLQAATPVYETMPAWTEEIGDCRKFDELPAAAQNYVRWLSDRLNTPVLMVGVGPDREQTIILERGA